MHDDAPSDERVNFLRCLFRRPLMVVRDEQDPGMDRLHAPCSLPSDPCIMQEPEILDIVRHNTQFAGRCCEEDTFIAR